MSAPPKNAAHRCLRLPRTREELVDLVVRCVVAEGPDIAREPGAVAEERACVEAFLDAEARRQPRTPAEACRAVAAEIREFDRACARAEHTDVDEAWRLLRRARRALLKAAR